MYDRRSRRFHKQISPVRVLLLFYFLAIIISAVVLSLPIVHQVGVEIPFIDHLFTAVSAISVTGLSTVTISNTYNTFGIIWIAIILQLGAVGVMAIGTFIWLLLGKKIGIAERELIKTEQNQTTFSGMVRLIRDIIFLLVIIEIIGFIVLGTYYLTVFPTAKEAYLHGFFSVISALSNGGFDITGHSLIPFQRDYFVQSIHMILIILGAIGFPVLIEVKDYLQTSRHQKKLFRFSLFTKLTTATFLLLILVGTILIYLFDASHYFAGKIWHENFFDALFQSVTTRSGGLSTIDINGLTTQ